MQLDYAIYITYFYINLLERKSVKKLKTPLMNYTVFFNVIKYNMTNVRFCKYYETTLAIAD